MLAGHGNMLQRSESHLRSPVPTLLWCRAVWQGTAPVHRNSLAREYYWCHAAVYILPTRVSVLAHILCMHTGCWGCPVGGMSVRQGQFPLAESFSSLSGVGNLCKKFLWIHLKNINFQGSGSADRSCAFSQPLLQWSILIVNIFDYK